VDEPELNTENKFTLNLSNAAQLVSFAIALGVIFSLIRNYIYYILLLHVPIFQYVDLSDIILIAPSGVFWALYFSAIETANFISKSPKFDRSEKIFYGILLYVFAGVLTWIGFYNEPIVEQGLKFIFRNWWFLIPLILYVAVRLKSVNSENDFFKKNKYTGACILVMWYAIFDSYSNYSVLVNPSRHIHLILKMKSGQKVRVDQNIIYAGRTANYWFLYNRKTNL
jgi:hypothetical protein